MKLILYLLIYLFINPQPAKHSITSYSTLACNVLFYAYMPMLLCDCQSFIKESYLLTYLHRNEKTTVWNK